MNLANYRKALIVPVVGLLVAFLGTLGITESMTVKDVAEFIVTMVAVWLIPNKKG